MTMLAEHPTVHRLARPGSAVSIEAETVWSTASAVEESQDRSFALFGQKAAAISQVWALANECAETGWDGEEAKPISEVSAGLAADFIRALPDNVPLPEFAPEPDGAISLDWIQSRSHLFSLSVGADTRLAFAWLDGADRGHGVARFDGETVPLRILEGIRGIMGHGNAAVRPP